MAKPQCADELRVEDNMRLGLNVLLHCSRRPGHKGAHKALWLQHKDDTAAKVHILWE